MSVVDKYCRSAHRRLDALQNDAHDEPWKVAYIEAESCHFFELALNAVLDVFKFIQEINRSWRMAVGRGIEEPNDHKDGLVKECFSRWLDLASSIEKTVLDFERRGYQIDRTDEFHEAIQVAETTLAKWFAPLPAQSPIMRMEDVSEEEADALHALLKSPPGSPGRPTLEPRRVPDGDASMLR